MKTVQISNRSKMINALLKEARGEDVILQAPDGTEFMLTMVDDFDAEIARQRRNEKLMAFLEARAQERGWIPLEEVERELDSPEKPANRSKTERNRHRTKRSET